VQAETVKEAAAPEVMPPASTAPSRKPLTHSKEEVLKSLAEAREAILKAQEVDSEAPQNEVATPSPAAAQPAAPADFAPELLPDQEDAVGARRYRRIAVSMRAQLAEAGRPPEWARVSDLSLGGVGLITDRNLGIGAACMVRFRLTMPDGRLFTLLARAQAQHSSYNSRQAGFKTGLRFIKVSDEGVAALTEFIADKTKTRDCSPP